MAQLQLAWALVCELFRTNINLLLLLEKCLTFARLAEHHRLV